jgi:hypothetical protein
MSDRETGAVMRRLEAIARKRTVFASLIARTIFGAVYGFAATLNVGTNTQSAGNGTVASCQLTGTPTGANPAASSVTDRRSSRR